MTVNENWTRDEVVKAKKKQAETALSKIKKSRVGKKFILVPHPSGHGMIEKEVKDE